MNEHIHESGFSSLVLAVFAFLLPLFFIPSAVYPFQFSKVMLGLLAVAIILIAFAVKTLRSGSLSFQSSWLSLGLLGLPVAYLASSIFSSVPSLSFFGYQLDQDTFGFIALCAALAFATTFAATSEKAIWKSLAALLIGGWVVILFQAIQIFFGVPIHFFGLFTSPIQNVVGKWNDLGLFVSLIASLSLLALEALPLSQMRKGIVVATLVVSLVTLVIVNFPLAWILLGIVAFMTLVSSLMRRYRGGGGAEGGTNGVASAIALAAVIFFVFFGSSLSASLQSHYGIQAVEVSPSFQGTLQTLESVYSKDPIFGSGPNTFANDWLMYRAPETLATPFWATEFNSGFAYIPTAFTTGGIAVALLWIVVIVLFLLTAFRALLSVSSTDERSYFLIVATTLGSTFLLVAHIFYAPSQSLTLLLFLFLGLFIASLRGTSLTRTVGVRFSESPRLAFISVVAVAVMMVAAIVSLYAGAEVYASSVVEGNAIVRSNANDLPGSLSAATQAASLSLQDRYLRTLVSLQLAQLSALAQKGGTDQKSQQDFQNTLSQAIGTSAAAVAANPLSYDNWLSRASVYEAVVPLNITGAADNAMAALESARKLNPRSPEVDYQEASIKAYAKDDAAAKTLAEAAVAKKADYTPAILLLAQLSINAGNINDAITSLKSALVFTPDDSSLLYQLGLLQLQAKLYSDAADSFNHAIAVTPNFANAQFFLGEADVFLGKKDEALALFNTLQAANPDNQTLKDVITKVTAGGNPFQSATNTLPPSTTPAPQQ